MRTQSRRSIWNHLNYEEINRQHEKCKGPYETHWNEEEGRIVPTLKVGEVKRAPRGYSMGQMGQRARHG